MFTRKDERNAAVEAVRAALRSYEGVKIDQQVPRLQPRGFTIVVAYKDYRAAFTIEPRRPGSSFVVSWFIGTRSEMRYPASFPGVNTFHFCKATTIFQDLDGLIKTLTSGLRALGAKPCA